MSADTITKKDLTLAAALDAAADLLDTDYRTRTDAALWARLVKRTRLVVVADGGDPGDARVMSGAITFVIESARLARQA